MILPILLLDSCKEEPLISSVKDVVVKVEGDTAYLANGFKTSPKYAEYLLPGDSVEVYYYRGHMIKEQIIYYNK